jgi:hypothetical protein
MDQKYNAGLERRVAAVGAVRYIDTNVLDAASMLAGSPRARRPHDTTTMWTHRIHVFAGSPRTAFIVRVGIGRVGVPLGTLVFIWSFVTNYATTFAHLRTLDGWLRMLLVAVLLAAEWVVGAGWIVGSVLWHTRGAARNEREHREHREHRR